MQGFLKSQGVCKVQEDAILDIIAGVGFKVSTMPHFQAFAISLRCLDVLLALQHEASPTSSMMHQGEMYVCASQDELGSGGKEAISPELACVQDADRYAHSAHAVQL